MQCNYLKYNYLIFRTPLYDYGVSLQCPLTFLSYTQAGILTTELPTKN